MIDEKIAIKIDKINKCYKMFSKPEDRLKQAFSKKKMYKEFWALRDISFTINKGEIVGIVGKNGSGKSTILQIIAGTLAPTSGRIELKGKVAALLELGSGFNPEFTGRENVYLCGSIYGISKSDMDKRFGSIEGFADIGDFIDQPVKTYSSGMFARLAFAVNIHVDADIIIVDEVLSVGDHFFQAKCMTAINRLMKNGTTILLVSHSQATIKALCNRAILLNNGILEMSGMCDEVMDRYMAISLEEQKKNQEKLYKNDSIKEEEYSVSIKNNQYESLCQPPFKKRITEQFGNKIATFIECAVFQDGKETMVIETGKKCTVTAWFQFNNDCEVNSEIGMVLRTLEGIDLFAINTFFSSVDVLPEKRGTVKKILFEFNVNLGVGRYSIALGMRSPIQGEYSDKIFNAAIFEVVNTTSRVIPLLFDVPGRITIE